MGKTDEVGEAGVLFRVSCLPVGIGGGRRLILKSDHISDQNYIT